MLESNRRYTSLDAIITVLKKCYVTVKL